VVVPPLIIEGIDDPIIKIGENKAGENQSSGENIDVDNSSESDNSSNSSNDEKQSTNEDNSDDETPAKQPTRSTRSGRTIREPIQLIKDLGATIFDEYEIKLSEAEEHYYKVMKELIESKFINGEIDCIGAGIGGGFTNTN
jgi:hypothetical protein